MYDEPVSITVSDDDTTRNVGVKPLTSRYTASDIVLNVGYPSTGQIERKAPKRKTGLAALAMENG